MRVKLAFFIGIAAVALYSISYLQKTRNKIIILNALSKVLYILQYILLGAFEGAVLDVAGILSSLLAQKKDTPFIKKYIRLIFGTVNVLIVVVGLLLYKNIFSILPIIAVILLTGAFWITDEKRIRQISFLGCPFWLIYNFVSCAYGSCIGDILSMVSIGISIFRYDLPLGKNKKKNLNFKDPSSD